MNAAPPREVVRELCALPGVGKTIAGDLFTLGIRRAADLRGQDPEDLYERLCEMQGQRIDRCMLYTFRCAVYAAGEGPHDPALMKWWAWSDLNLARRGA